MGSAGTTGAGRDDDPALIDLTAPRPLSLDERAAQYSAWAERMREKRRSAKDHIAASRSTTPTGIGAGTYWDPQALFADSMRVADADADASGGPDPAHVAGLLARLGLPPDAGPDSVTEAYRNAAKVHHPDRWGQASESVRAEHQSAIVAVNQAYRRLRELGRA